MLAAQADVQTARIRLVPEYVSTLGTDAVDLAAMAGWYLDPWQAEELTESMGQRADGKWAARDVGQVVPRQNGKNGTLVARQLAGLFLLNEQLQIHTAHEFKTCAEHFLNVKTLIENTDAFIKRCKKPRVANGEQQIETLKGYRLRFLARSKASGRGFSCDTLYYDEAYELAEATQQASGPSQSARRNPQTWYTSSPVDQEIHENGLVLARLRTQALSGAAGIAYFEHSADLTFDATDEELADVANWAVANPGRGIRITDEEIARELRMMSRRGFLVERLGVGDWPDPEATDSPITSEMWSTCGDPTAPRPTTPVMFAVDMTPLRTHTSIMVCGTGRGDKPHVETSDSGAGSNWVVARCVELRDRHKPLGFVIDQRSAAGSLIDDLREAGIDPIVPTTIEATQACGQFYDAVRDGKVSHRHDRELNVAVNGAATRAVGDAWMWARRGATDISPLVAATNALWGWNKYRNQRRAIDQNVW